METTIKREDVLIIRGHRYNASALIELLESNESKAYADSILWLMFHMAEVYQTLMAASDQHPIELGNIPKGEGQFHYLRHLYDCFTQLEA